MKEKKHIITVGLRRSGTTNFWELFRQDKRFLSFDEPFNETVGYTCAYKNDNSKNSFTEYINREQFFWSWWSHISPFNETIPILNWHQAQYIKQLFQLNEHLNVDFTRIHNKIDIIRNLIPDALIVLIIRDPRSWVTSQLKPKGCFVDPRLPEHFFDFMGFFDHWGYQRMATYLSYFGMAHQILLKLWININKAAINLKPDLIIQHEDFCLRSQYWANEIYDKLDIEKPDVLDHSYIHDPNKPFDLKSDKWDTALMEVGINKYIWTDWNGSNESKDYLYNKTG